jgi:acyl-CoA thioesterase-2
VRAPHELSFAEGLSVVPLGEGRFRSRYPGWNGYPRVFGGLLLAQAISAAAGSVAVAKLPISQQGCFLRPANPGDEVELVVETVRDGRSFSTREVRSYVEGAETSRFLVSFQIPEESPSYQLAMPAAPPPDDLPRSDEQLPFEVVELGHSGADTQGRYAWTRRCWLRCVAPMDPGSTFQAAAMAYASDLTTTAFTPGAETQAHDTTDASLDHALWLHRPSDLAEWHLFELNCVAVSGWRATARGTIYSADGILRASMAQELLNRPLEGPPLVPGEGRWAPE